MVLYSGHLPRLLLLASFLGNFAEAQPKPEIVIAAAANLTQAMQAMGPAFEAETGIHPVFSFGSTSQLAQQIEYGAPFDVFLAADAEHVDQLDRKGLLAPASRAVYAQGIAALWIPNGDKVPVHRLEDLTNSQIRVIAIAKPELAPYGQAAVTALKRAGLWNQLEAKVVYAENINMAKQYGSLENADAVFTAYALVQHAGGTVIRVDANLHPPIQQVLGIMARAEHPDAARKFADYLLHGHGRAMLHRFGYLQP
jgi:molybdate transport system substrate-binding protein